MTHPDTTALRKLLEASDIDPASDAHPWRVGINASGFIELADARGRMVADFGCWDRDSADLIVAAVNGLPGLLDRIDELEFELKKSFVMFMEARTEQVQFVRDEDQAARIAALESGLCEACDLADMGWDEDHSSARQRYGTKIAGLRKLVEP